MENDGIFISNPNNQKLNFILLNFNLKIYIFQYLDKYDLIHILFLNKKIRLLVEKLDHRFNDQIMRVFFYLLSLKNYKSFTNDKYINHYHKAPLLSSIFDKFQSENIKEEDIYEGITLYLNFLGTKTPLSYFNLNQYFPREFLVLFEIHKKLDKYKFCYEIFYHIHMDELLLNFIDFLDTENYFSIHSTYFNPDIFKIFNKNKFEAFFKKVSGRLEDTKEINNYFNQNRNHLEILDCLNFDALPEKVISIIKLNKNSLTRLENFNFNAKHVEKSFLAEFAKGLKNLEYLKISSRCPNLESSVFKNLKTLKGLPIDENNKDIIYTFFSDHHLLENLEIKLKISDFDFKSEKLNFLKYNLLKLNVNTQDMPEHELNLKDFEDYIKLKKFSSYNKFCILDKYYFQLKKVLHMRIKQDCDYKENFKFLNKLIKNHDGELEETGISTNHLEFFLKFISFVNQENQNLIPHNIIKFLHLENTYSNDYSILNQISGPIFNNLHNMTLLSSNMLCLLNITQTLDSVEFNYIFSKEDQHLLNYLKGKSLRAIILNRCHDDIILKFIAENRQDFKYLRMININCCNPFTYCNIQDILESIVKLDLVYFGIRLNMRRKYRQKEIVKKLRDINGVEIEYTE
jgi:hypothetical protein